MIIEKQITKYWQMSVEFDGLTLLSKQEYDESKRNIPSFNRSWWLRSPGYCQCSAALVSSDGSRGGTSVNYARCVRPALILNPKSCMFVGEKFVFDDHHWTVISPQYALCDDEYRYTAFRKDWRACDANDYNESDIKKYLDEVWDRMKRL